MASETCSETTRVRTLLGDVGGDVRVVLEIGPNGIGVGEVKAMVAGSLGKGLPRQTVKMAVVAAHRLGTGTDRRGHRRSPL